MGASTSGERVKVVLYHARLARVTKHHGLPSIWSAALASDPELYTSLIPLLLHPSAH